MLTRSLPHESARRERQHAAQRAIPQTLAELQQLLDDQEALKRRKRQAGRGEVVYLGTVA